MSQHFLLSVAARTLSLASVARMSEEEARATFARIRWADNNGEAYCPRCGCVKVYALSYRHGWKCSGCKHQFSVTSGTIFADRKMPIRDILLALAIFGNSAKGHPALQLSRDLDCSYKAAFVLSGKIREAIEAEQQTVKLSGEVEVDGCYFVQHQRRNNRGEKRSRNQPKRQVVVVMRQRGGRSATVVVPREGDAVSTIFARVAPDTVVHADEGAGWHRLYMGFDNVKRVNHSVEYRADDGGCVNWCESYFARLRRAEFGIHHRISGQYLNYYAAEMSFREDFRRISNGAMFNKIASLTARHAVSKQWCGYWHRAEKARAQ